MQNLSAFLNPVKPDDIKVVVSERFRDENDNPIKWELRPITGATDKALRKRFTIPAKRKQPQSFDTNGYTIALCVATVSFPNLNAAELQDGYGVMGAEALLEKMLLPGELLSLMTRVQEVNGFDMDFGELEEEAKN